MTDPIDLIIFDCDGVLVDSEPLAIRVNQEMVGELGWPITEDEIIEHFVGKSMKTIVPMIAERTGRPVPDGWTGRFMRRIHEVHAAELTSVAGIASALSEIGGYGVPMCVASSGSLPKIEHSLGLTGLRDHFAAIFSASQVLHGKPAPDLFEFAAAQMGTEPKACVVIEDSRFGVIGARAAGMRSFGYAGGVTPAGWLAGDGTVVFDDMRDLPALLRAAGLRALTQSE